MADQSINFAKGAIIRLQVSFSCNSAIQLHGGFVKTQIVAGVSPPELCRVAKIKRRRFLRFSRESPQQSGVALRLPPQSKSFRLGSACPGVCGSAAPPVAPIGSGNWYQPIEPRGLEIDNAVTMGRKLICSCAAYLRKSTL
jgi:hypothetical protein